MKRLFFELKSHLTLHFEKRVYSSFALINDGERSRVDRLADQSRLVLSGFFSGFLFGFDHIQPLLMTHVRTTIWPLWKTHTSQLGHFLSLTFCVYLLLGSVNCPINHWRFLSFFLLSFTFSSVFFCLFCLLGSFLLSCLLFRLFLLGNVLNFLLLSALPNPSLLLLASEAYMSELLQLLLSFIRL